MTERIILWRVPGKSDRVHWLKLCSGGGSPRAQRVYMTREQYQAATKCRCCPREFRAGAHPHSLVIR